MNLISNDDNDDNNDYNDYNDNESYRHIKSFISRLKKSFSTAVLTTQIIHPQLVYEDKPCHM
jgi:hypothetical protein